MSVETETSEQVVRMVLQGTEVVLRLSGQAAIEMAKMIYSALKNDATSKGKATLWEFLRSGRKQMVFEIPDEYINAFTKASKQYGFPFVILKNKDSDKGVTDIMVYESDASKVERVKENLKLNIDGINKVKAEVSEVKDKAYKPTGMQYRVPVDLIDNIPELPEGVNITEEQKVLVSNVKKYAAKMKRSGPQIVKPIELVVKPNGHYEVIEGRGRKRLMALVLAGYKEAVADISVPVKDGSVIVEAVTNDSKEPQDRSDTPKAKDDSPAPAKKEDVPEQKAEQPVNPSMARTTKDQVSGLSLGDFARIAEEKDSKVKPSVRKELETCKQIAADRVAIKVPTKTPNIKR